MPQLSPNRVRIHLPESHPEQRRVLQAAQRFNIACCGRRWGKSKLGEDLLIARPPFGAIHGTPVGWFAPTYKLLLEAWDSVRRKLAPITLRTSAQEHRLELATGSTVEFWTLDDEDAGRSRKYGRAIIDEAAMVRGLTDRWQQAIRPTLTDLKGDAWFFSTPKGRNDFATLYDEATGPEWARWQLPSHGNPSLDPAELEAAREGLPELVWRQEYLADFVDFEGATIRREWLREGTPPKRAHLDLVMGVDLAISTKSTADWTTAVTLGRDRYTGYTWVLSAARIRAPFHEGVDFIRRAWEQHRPSAILVEDVQFQAAVVQELLLRTTLPVRGYRPERDKVTRFLPLAARYEAGQVWHAPGLPEEFTAELLAFPVGEHDDFIDGASTAYTGFGMIGATVAGGFGARVM